MKLSLLTFPFVFITAQAQAGEFIKSTCVRAKTIEAGMTAAKSKVTKLVNESSSFRADSVTPISAVVSPDRDAREDLEVCVFFTISQG